MAIKSKHIKDPVCLDGHHADFRNIAPTGLLQAEVLSLLCASSRNHKILLVKHNNFCHHSFNCSHIRATKHYLVETEDNEEKSKERESFVDFSAKRSKPKVPLNPYNRRPANDKKKVGNDVIW